MIRSTASTACNPKRSKRSRSRLRGPSALVRGVQGTRDACRVSDERVALYLEEPEPSLQAAILSALEVGRPAADAQGEPAGAALSPGLIHRLLETAIEKCRAIDEGRSIDAAALRQAGGALAGLALISVVIFLLSPAAVRHGVDLGHRVDRGVVIHPDRRRGQDPARVDAPNAD